MDVVREQLNDQGYRAVIGGEFDQGVVHGEVYVPVGVVVMYGTGGLHEPIADGYHPFAQVVVKGVPYDQVTVFTEVFPLLRGKGREIHDMLFLV